MAMRPGKAKPRGAKKKSVKKAPAKKTSSRVRAQEEEKRPSSRRMPEFSKPSQRTLDAFNHAVERVDGVERKTMFGYPAVFVNGNMLASVFQDRIMIRLSERDRIDALRVEGASLFEPSPGRPMRQYVDFPASVIGDASLLAEWLRRGAEYVASMPLKQKKR